MSGRINDIQLFYEDLGSGDILCLLHGFLENRLMWKPIVEILSKKNRIIIIDLPGHGKSPLLKESNSMQAMALAVDSVFEKLGVESVKFVGHSMGGYVALAFAKAFPHKTKGVLLLNSTPEADTDERKQMRMHAVDMAGRNYEALVSMSVANLFSVHKRTEFDDAIASTKADALQVSAETYITCQKSMSLRPDYSEYWKKADFKRNMILGSDDGLINYNAMQKKFRSCGVKIDVLEGGHMLHIENFMKVMELLLQF